MALIDAAGAFALLERVVAERGAGYIYGSPEGTCLYVHTSDDGELTPGCGVGLAATYAGVDLKTLQMWDLYAPPTITCIPQSKFDSGATMVLGAFQRKQDSGAMYGFALQEARRELENVA